MVPTNTNLTLDYHTPKLISRTSRELLGHLALRSGPGSVPPVGPNWNRMRIFARPAAPLSRLIQLLRDSDSSSAQADLAEMLDLKMWGRYSAFETLTQSLHAEEVHNWGLYYDPWRQTFLPVVWDLFRIQH